MLKNKHGYHLQAHELYPLLGLPVGHHLPDEGMPPKEIEGVTFFVKPKTENRRAHRVHCVCTCGRDIPFGRMGQHLKAH